MATSDASNVMRKQPRYGTKAHEDSDAEHQAHAIGGVERHVRGVIGTPTDRYLGRTRVGTKGQVGSGR